MQRILVIAENSLQQERLCTALNLDESVQISAVKLRQISPRNLRTFRRADLIVLEDTSEQEDPRTTEFLISSLKTTGLPIVLLPAIDHKLESDNEPLVLNLTEESIAKPGLVGLINKVREQFVASTQTDKEQIGSQQQGGEPLQPRAGDWAVGSLRSGQPTTDNSELANSREVAMNELISSPMSPSLRPEVSSKVIYALTSIGRISKQLREPLSNMNLAIHMLGRVESIEERDRYVKLLREEYQRELQLVNELENLHSSLETIL